MSIETLHKASGIVSALIGGTDPHEVNLARAIGISLGMAVDIRAFNDIDNIESIDKTALITRLNEMDEVYRMINACNEQVIICTETAVAYFVRMVIIRVKYALGDYSALMAKDLCAEYITAAAKELIPCFKAALAK